jgi:hypothetical protein
MTYKLPRANTTGPMVLLGPLWNLLCDLVERAVNFTVAPPLIWRDLPSGRCLSIEIPPTAGVVFIEINEYLGDGKYAGGLQRSKTGEVSVETMSAPTDFFTGLEGASPVVLWNLFEAGLASHALSIGQVVWAVKLDSTANYLSSKTPWYVTWTFGYQVCVPPP